MDNTTAIAYINRMGGLSTVLASLVYEIWQWCLKREISITAQHIPGIYNKISRDFQGQIRGKNGRFRGKFAGIFEASFAEK